VNVCEGKKEQLLARDNFESQEERRLLVEFVVCEGHTC
jgi:hypothetical protein